MTPFYVACYLGHIEIIKIMLTEPKLDITITDNDGVILNLFQIFF